MLSSRAWISFKQLRAEFYGTLLHDVALILSAVRAATMLLPLS